MQAIRILHFADLHIGVESYGHLDPQMGVSSRVRDFLNRFDEVVDYAIGNGVDAVIFCGDAYRNRDPGATYQREFARRIKRLVDEDIPILLLVGNHDLPAMPKKASSLDIFHTLEIPGVTVARRPGIYRIETKHGPFQAVTVPYPTRALFLAGISYRGKSIEEIDRLMARKVAEEIENLASKVDEELPTVLVGHFSVMGARYGSERSIMLGRDIILAKSVLASSPWDYVALGHIHRHQDLNEGFYPPVVYAGSLERIDFGEEGEEKGFVEVYLRKGETTYQFIPVKARPFITIEADVRAARDPTEAALQALSQHQVKNAVVRVNVKLLPEQEASFQERKLMAALKDAYYIASINRDVERVYRLRLEVKAVEELGPRELLEKYLELKKVSEERRKLLLQYAEELIREEEASGDKAG
ncbi:MAG: hypothetical protein DRI61_01825 [Chloroflexi bacterium]|nr:MAG: hypothetical protein DRI61_01825 [Chloroflexota bacterium]HDN79930.1 exonuclease SbcCD subunit D [Chloroflexota bacterium]